MPEALATERFPGIALNIVNGYLKGRIDYGHFGAVFIDEQNNLTRLDNLTPEQKQSITIEPAKIRTLRNLAAAQLHPTEATGPYEDVRNAALQVQNIYHPTGGRKPRGRTKMPRRHTKKRGTRKHRKMRGGYYAFSGAVGPGAANYVRGSEMGGFAVDKAGNIGNIGPSGTREIFYGSGRRKSRGRRTRKTRRMRGGSKYGAVSASYNGTGDRGMANHVAVNSKYPPFGGAQDGAFNNAADYANGGHYSNIMNPIK